ncbi:DUF2971 domain-containing protein [Clostridium sp. JS66]|uniref:DUF2971 domain-containing protein n=1 Tax=Clostridium sp. JS66 TaxID=3064705 RepID=UPI00298DFA6A|nr:DUF2971 domain-containing protein [Clostridium sp. JS66]WPC44276.1 DUF2971 domain-containing protein [Clostridium sp. JS66]
MNEKELRESLGFKDKVVYHYCSVRALYGILNTKSFWLTSLESSNDSMELKIAKKTIEQAIKELKNEYKETDYLEMFKNIENAPNDEKYVKVRPKYKYYGLSFVENRDSLTHWERYADNCKGVCIGLNIPLIEHLFFNYSLPNITANWLQTSEILYSYKEQVECAKASIMAKIQGFEKMTDNNLTHVEHIFSSIYYSTLATLRPRFKHLGFSDEREHRVYLEEGEAEEVSQYYKRNAELVVATSKELFFNISKNTYELAKLLQVLKTNKKYGVFGDIIRSYYSMNLSEIWSDTLITEIILGPKCFQNKKELKSFLKSCGLYKTKIDVSKIPLR